MDYTKIVQEEDYLEHHGIKGMHWGIRRYQNADGSLTEEGKRRYDIKEAKIKAKAEKAIAKAQVKNAKMAIKAEKLNAKNLKRETKAQEKLKKFGDAFLPALGRSFGDAWGSGMGRTLGDFQKWKELRNTAYSNKTARMEKELAKAKYDSGFADKTLKKEEKAAEAALRSAIANYANASNRNKELDLQIARFQQELREARYGR